MSDDLLAFVRANIGVEPAPYQDRIMRLFQSSEPVRLIPDRGFFRRTEMGLSLTLGYMKPMPEECDGLEEDDENWTDDCYEGVGNWEGIETFYNYGYHTLMVIREYVANVEGIPDLMNMPAYRDSTYLFKFRPGLEPKPDSWDKYPTTLMPFFMHSDADGFWTPDECRQMLPRLQEIYNNAPKWLNRYEAFGKLVYGIRKAASADYHIKFG